MPSIQDTILNLLETQALPVALAQLQAVRDNAKKDWEKSLVDITINFASREGHEAIGYLKGLIADLIKGKIDISLFESKLTLREASDLLAVLQQHEADTKDQVHVILQQIVDALVAIGQTMLKVLLQGAAGAVGNTAPVTTLLP